MQVPTLEDRRPPRLIELCNEVFGRRRLIIVSNRGPVEFHLTPDGRLQARRGSGGVVTALGSLIRYVDFTWVASAMGEGDRRAVEQAGGARIRSPVPGQKVSVRFVVTPRRTYHKFYNIFCNPLLWFLQHYMWSSPYTPNIDAVVHDAWETGYIPVNQAFAEVVLREAEEAGGSPIIMFHDYHLYLAPAMVRQQAPDCFLHHFVHIPWPSPRYWLLLPYYMRRAICEGLCACDVVGFQSWSDVANFIESCRLFLDGVEVDHNNHTIYYKGRRTLVRAYPISIDVEEVRRIANSPRALEYERKIRQLCAERTIVRVDRVEPSKNIIRGFRAYYMLLERHPELHGRVKFLAFLVPSRTHIKQYERYLHELDEVVRTINTTFGREDWQPVQVFYENNYTQAIAAMRLYDVLLVNPVIDGMNLVAKEGPVVNTRHGVLILSEGAGAYEQLKEGAFSVSPSDLEGMVRALYEAVTLPEEERRRRSALLVEAVEREDIAHWLTRQIEDVRALL